MYSNIDSICNKFATVTTKTHEAAMVKYNKYNKYK